MIIMIKEDARCRKRVSSGLFTFENTGITKKLLSSACVVCFNVG